MFDISVDSPLAGEGNVPPAGELSDLLVDNHRELMARECRQLLLAALWADAHDPEIRPRSRSRHYGGEGTPEVSEFAAAELGALLETSTFSAGALIGDALDLRHRLPETWDRVLEGTVRAWKARKVAAATRHLASEQALVVDCSVAPHLSTLPWGRCLTVLEAAVIDVDPETAEERVKAAEAERFVRPGKSNARGLKVLIAQAAAGDVIWFIAMVNRIAEILSADGDSDPVDVRRSKAIGILAQPAYALHLLTTHAEPSLAAGFTEPDPAGDHVSVGVSNPRDVDYRKLKPTVVLHVHITHRALIGEDDGVARVEGVGPVTIGQVQRFLGDATCQLRIQPVLDPADVAAVDAYEIPQRLRDAVWMRNPADVFPWGTNTSRMRDLDHTVPFDPLRLADRQAPSSREAQTALANLGPLSRGHHRAKTLGGWRLRQPDPGSYLWRSPHGWIFLCTNAGSLNLGRGAYARAAWKVAGRGAGSVTLAA